MMTYASRPTSFPKQVVAARDDVPREMGVVRFAAASRWARTSPWDELRKRGFCAFTWPLAPRAAVARALTARTPRASPRPWTSCAGAALDDPNHEVKAPRLSSVAATSPSAPRVSRCAAAPTTSPCSAWRPATMPALPEEVSEAEEDGVHVNCGWGPASIQVDESGHVSGVTFKRCTSVLTTTTALLPTYDESETFVPCTNVVISIGQSIEWGDLLAGSAVELAAATPPWRTPHSTRRRSPTSLWAATPIRARASRSTPSPPATRQPESCTAMRRRAPRSPSAEKPAALRGADKSDILVDPNGYDHCGCQCPPATT